MASGVLLIHLNPDFPENYYLFSKLGLAALAVGIFGFYFIQRLKTTSIAGGWLSRQVLGRRVGKFLSHLQEFDDRLVQFYTEKLNSTIKRPSQELKSFAKTKLLENNESTDISVKIPINELSYWNESINDWSLEKGEYNIKVGGSSRNISQILKINL